VADVRALTADYEDWLGKQIPVRAEELERKHAEMASEVFRFLRGTYYAWLVRASEHVPDALGSAPVPLVGDLHVENFGTWRDRDQVRRWGVNDLDELARGPWVLDLLRLAVSAVLAPNVALDEPTICATVLETWRATDPRPALDLTEKGSGHIRRLLPEFGSPAKFYAALEDAPPADVAPAVAAAAAAVAEAGWAPTWRRHVAGTGSLGHARVVGVGPAADGRMHAREAKELGPGTATWAAGRAAGMPRPEVELYARVTAAVRGPAGATRVDDWQIRDLAPDVVRIDLRGLRAKDAGRLLRSMTRAVVDVHGSDAAAFATARDDALTAGGFAAMVHAMVEATEADWADYR
jgi:uncharacterized protein (DUF2252 family)